jgi:hypothetical protein
MILASSIDRAYLSSHEISNKCLFFLRISLQLVNSIETTVNTNEIFLKFIFLPILRKKNYLNVN